MRRVFPVRECRDHSQIGLWFRAMADPAPNYWVYQIYREGINGEPCATA